MVFFDIPVVTKAERRAYTVFRRFLINDGYDIGLWPPAQRQRRAGKAHETAGG
jgi:CRISPR/Cas system-associated protein endoribonuclease Cas2